MVIGITYYGTILSVDYFLVGTVVRHIALTLYRKGFDPDQETYQMIWKL